MLSVNTEILLPKATLILLKLFQKVHHNTEV